MEPGLHAIVSWVSRIVRVALSGLVLGGVGTTGPAASQEGAPPPRLRRIALPEPAIRIIQVTESGIVALSADGRRVTLIDPVSGNASPAMPLGGTVVALASRQDGTRPPKLAVLTRPGDPAVPSALDLTVLTALREGLRVRWSRREVVPPGYEQPGLRFLASIEGEENALLVWDRAAGPASRSYRLVQPSGQVEEHFAKLPPTEFLGLRGNRLMLALSGSEGGASLIDIKSGRIEDTVFVDGLPVSDPTQLATFVPNQRLGGTSDVLAANAQTLTLSVLSVAKLRVPRIAPPVQISLRRLALLPLGGRRLLVAAERDLSFVAVGIEGTPRLAIFRRISGALQEAGPPFDLETPIRDMMVFDSQSGAQSDTFVFLSTDGREVLIVPEIQEFVASGILSDPPEAQTVAFAGTDLDAADIARLQRVLARLGYSVGAVDGMIGANTTAAIRAFQFDRKLGVTGRIDQATIDALNAAIVKIQEIGTDTAYLADYAAFMAEYVPALRASRLLTLGVSHESPDSLCFGLNKLPPRDLWKNSIPFARVLNRLIEQDLKVEIVSGYRSPEYGRCLTSSSTGSYHTKFQAFDIRLEDAQTSADGNRRLTGALKELRAQDVFKGAIGVAGRAVHVDTRGVNVDFGSSLD